MAHTAVIYPTTNASKCTFQNVNYGHSNFSREELSDRSFPLNTLLTFQQPPGKCYFKFQLGECNLIWFAGFLNERCHSSNAENFQLSNFKVVRVGTFELLPSPYRYIRTTKIRVGTFELSVLCSRNKYWKYGIMNNKELISMKAEAFAFV